MRAYAATSPIWPKSCPSTWETKVSVFLTPRQFKIDQDRETRRPFPQGNSLAVQPQNTVALFVCEISCAIRGSFLCIKLKNTVQIGDIFKSNQKDF